jgi:hypothetical protein
VSGKYVRRAGVTFCNQLQHAHFGGTEPARAAGQLLQ